ncbi:hypothetical protein KPH14_006770 [Odynerus spinipes]|uniref:Uncharacterized protein n=1 Tax=Odynerus spinipes TaxID=1348599 RepID=A0AAD9RR73_9HYME|nr:hypothetical protein KPH14_006770 [Odynerus spinipes]
MDERVSSIVSTTEENIFDDANEDDQNEFDKNARSVNIVKKDADAPRNSKFLRCTFVDTSSKYPKDTKCNGEKANMIVSPSELSLKEKGLMNREKTSEVEKKKDRISENRHVIDLNEKRSKMALQEAFMAVLTSSGTSTNYRIAPHMGGNFEEEIEKVSKFSREMIIVEQERKSCGDENDYARDSNETNSSGGSSCTSGYVAEKMKRISRTLRNKSRGSLEVRRNPMRVSKKDMDKNFRRPRQCLLSAKRKDSYSNSVSMGSNRTKSSPTPYMNTRSVTRKMCNVGATYQAPTIRDETQWKEWPVHGMHERPVFHPQAGLAVEYLGRYFISLDGLSYREIIDQSEIEVVSVDPHGEWSSSGEKKRGRKVITTVYRKNTEEKRKRHQDDRTLSDGSNNRREFPGSLRNCNRKSLDVITHNSRKSAEEENFLEGYAIAMSQSIQNSANFIKTSSWSAPTSTMFVTERQKPSNNFYNVQTLHSNQVKFANILPRPSPKSSLIFVRTTDAKTSGCYSTSSCNPIFKPFSSEMSTTKLGDTVHDDTLMEMNTVYKTLIPKEDSFTSCENSVSVNNLCRKGTMNYTNKPQNFVMTKCLFTARQEKRETSQNDQNIKNARKNFNDRSTLDIALHENKDNNFTGSNANENWSTNETSEIAKILSEYNRSIARKSAIQPEKYTAPLKTQKPNILRTSSKDTKDTIWNKDERRLDINSRSDFTERNTSIRLPHGKWRRFHFTVEKIKDSMDINDRQPAFVEHQQATLKNSRISTNNANTTSSTPRRENRRKSLDPYRSYEMLPRSENSSGMNCLKKECTSTKLENPKKTQSLQELLESTAVLYCTTTGARQEDLSEYVDTMDTTDQSVQWLDSWNDQIT